MFNFKFKRNNKYNGFRSKSQNACSRFVGEYKVIKQEQLYEFVNQDICIIDVRTANEFKGMRLKNAINIPLNMLSIEILNIVPNKETKILVYCISGQRTFAAIQKLNSLGYRNIYIWGNGGLNTLKYKDLLDY